METPEDPHKVVTIPEMIPEITRIIHPVAIRMAIRVPVMRRMVDRIPAVEATLPTQEEMQTPGRMKNKKKRSSEI